MASRDYQLVVMGPFGRIDLAHMGQVTGFDSRQNTATLNRWEGTFTLERGSAAGDDFLRRVGDGVPPSTLYQYVGAPDGSTSTYQYDGVTFRFPDVADRDASARQTVEFFAISRRRI